jgi:hypothetical protein
VVAAQRDGRIIRYSLADEAVGALLAEVFPPVAAPAGADAVRG